MRLQESIKGKEVSSCVHSHFTSKLPQNPSFYSFVRANASYDFLGSPLICPLSLIKIIPYEFINLYLNIRVCIHTTEFIAALYKLAFSPKQHMKV